VKSQLDDREKKLTGAPSRVKPQPPHVAPDLAVVETPSIDEESSDSPLNLPSLEQQYCRVSRAWLESAEAVPTKHTTVSHMACRSSSSGYSHMNTTLESAPAGGELDAAYSVIAEIVALVPPTFPAPPGTISE